MLGSDPTPQFGLARVTARHAQKVLLALAVCSVMTLPWSAASAAPSAGTLANPDNSVAALANQTPRPLPKHYGFPVENPSNEQGTPVWGSAPLMLANGSTVVYVPAATPPCVGSREVCPPQNEIQEFPPGYFGGPSWTYTIPNGKDGSQPIWSGGAIAFIETKGQDQAPYSPLPPVVLVRLSPSGHLLSSSTLPMPHAFSKISAGTVLVSPFPASGGILLSEWAIPKGATPPGLPIVEKIDSQGRVDWVRPATTVAWSRGSIVVLQSTVPSTYEVVSSENGHLLWRMPTKPPIAGMGAVPGFPVVDAGVVLTEQHPLHDVSLTVLTARVAATGRILWQRRLHDVAWFASGANTVFADANLVACASVAAVDLHSQSLPTCSQYGSRTGSVVRQITVPNAPLHSAVEAIASSRSYLLVEVLKAPWLQNCTRSPMWGGCQPSGVFTEAVPWSGKGPSVIAQGQASQQLTYNLGTGSSITVTGVMIGWRW